MIQSIGVAHSIGDKVWTMHKNEVNHLTIKTITIIQHYNRQVIEYSLEYHTEKVQKFTKYVFNTKQELLESL